MELNVQMVPVGEISFEISDGIPLTLDRRVERPDARSRGLFSETFYPTLVVVIPEIQMRMLPESNVWNTTETWPLIGVHRFRTLQKDVVSYQNPGGHDLVFNRPIWFTSLSEAQTEYLVEPGVYKVGAYLSVLNHNSRDLPYRISAKEKYEALPDHSVTTIEVVDSRRAHFRITPPTDFAQQAREAVDASDNDDKLKELLGRVWPVELEFVGQQEMRMRKRESSPRYGRPNGGRR